MSEKNTVPETDEIREHYNILFTLNMTPQEISEKMDSMDHDPDIIQYRQFFADELVYMITSGTMEYGVDTDFHKDPLVKVFLRNAESILHKDGSGWIRMMHGLFSRNNKELFDGFNEHAESLVLNGQSLTEGDLVDLYIEPLKDACKGFWEHAQEKLTDLCKKDGTHELCSLLGRLYERESDEDGINALTQFIQKYPALILPREYLALLYMNTKNWNNAAAWFESVADSPMLFANIPARLFFLMGITYEKAGNFPSEEEAYKKCLELAPEYEFAGNNLAYCLYRQKKYQEARSILEECLEQNRDLPYAANNMIRVLVALGRNKDAKAIAANKKYRISKALKVKVERLPDSNVRMTKADSIAPSFEEEDNSIPENNGLILKKGTQFSTEKILEDELTVRLEKGLPVFGKKLKIYKRKGEYGRQYIIPVGRLDLLCEDEKGDLYIIELKKDSGYDDVYAQITSYLDWFKNSTISFGKQVFGIICLNSPSEELIEKVHSDNRIKMFEYQVSYTEV